MMMTKIWWLGCCLVTATALAGCGGGSDTKSMTTAKDDPAIEPNAIQQAKQESTADDQDDQAVITTSAVGKSSAKNSKSATTTETADNPTADEGDDSSGDDLKVEAPKKETPEWFIYKITQVKLKPLFRPDDAEAHDVEKQAELRRERNEQIVELATEAIARTHKETSKDQRKERVFDLAVHHLLEAELQLAIAGEQDHIDALYEHASLLYQRNPKSKAAIVAGMTLINFARMNAQKFGREEPKTLEEFARLARQFAKNFPQEERQAIPVLFAAGQSCEFHGLTGEASQCYATITEQFPESQAAQRVTPIMRRLNLKGKPLQLAGPAIGGEFLNAEEMTGKPLLVVFWTTQAQPFVRQLPKLQELVSQIDPKRLNVISVNFDDDDNESAVQTFMDTNGLNWPTIFETESEKRGWNNPIASHYGIQNVPMYWIASSKGNVVEMAYDIDKIEPLLKKLMVPRKAAANEEKPETSGN